MSGSGEYISREETLKRMCKDVCNVSDCQCDERRCPEWYVIHDAPAADVRPVVLCGICTLHGHCYTEDVFAFARLAEENRFCAVGKVKTNGEKREES